MRWSQGRSSGRTALGLAAATATLMALGLPSTPAGAATATPTATPTATATSSPASGGSFSSGATSASGVQLVANFPQPMPGMGQSLSLGLINSAGTLTHTLTPTSDKPETAKTTSGLGSGTLLGADGPLAPLNQTVTATLADPGPKTFSLGSTPDNPLLTLSGGNLLAVTKPGATPSTEGTGQLADLSLGSLSDILPAQVLDPVTSGLQTLVGGLQPVLTQVTGAIAQVTAGCTTTGASPTPSPSPSTSASASPNPLDPVTGPVAGGIGQVGDGLGSALGPVVTQICSMAPAQADAAKAALGALQQQLQALINALPNLITALTKGSLVSLTGLDVAQSVDQSASAITSTATSKLGKLSLLGGFITVEGFENRAVATTTGAAGGAKGTATPGLADVKVGDSLLGLAIGPNGLTLPAGTPLAGLSDTLAPVNSALLQVVDQLNAILSQAGLTVKQSAGTQSAAPDGSAASARASSLLISYTIPTTSAPLVELAVGDAQAAVASGQGTAVQAESVTPVLARTGADLPLTAGAALLLLVAALFLLRRRSARS